MNISHFRELKLCQHKIKIHPYIDVSFFYVETGSQVSPNYKYVTLLRQVWSANSKMCTHVIINGINIYK
jgi:hypothetical protein